MDVLELGLGAIALRDPFLELSILGRGAVVPSPVMGKPVLMAELLSRNSVSLSSSSSHSSSAFPASVGSSPSMSSLLS